MAKIGRRNFLSRLGAGAFAGFGRRSEHGGDGGAVGAPVAESGALLGLAERLRTSADEEAFAVALDAVDRGATHRDVLGAVFLAGVQDIRPRPVGFKLHAVMMTASALQLAAAGPAAERLLPALFNLADLKVAQRRDHAQGDWHLPPAPDVGRPEPEATRQAVVAALESWDDEAADRAATAAAAALDRDATFELLWPYAARDYRDIGHKAIYAAAAYRVLRVIGWRYAAAPLRSLVSALLSGGPRATAAPFAANRERGLRLAPSAARDERDAAAVPALLARLRDASPAAASAAVAAAVARGVSPEAAWDALRLMAAELLTRSPGLLAVHPCTTVNALQLAYRTTRDDATRGLVLLQAAAWLPLFRDELRRRVGAADAVPAIDALAPSAQRATARDAHAAAAADARAAVRVVLGVARDAEDRAEYLAETRRLVLRNGDESHHYKYGAAVIEDVGWTDARWKPHLVAASLSYLPTASAPDAVVFRRARHALEARSRR